MSVMQREAPHGLVNMSRKSSRGPTQRVVGIVVLALIMALLLYRVVSVGVWWAQIKLDDIRYGYPRTFSMETYVGFGESNKTPTHVVAMNLHGQIVVLVMPGDSPTKVTVLKGPFIFGAVGQYASVTLQTVRPTSSTEEYIVATVDGQNAAWVIDSQKRVFRSIHEGERQQLSRILSAQII